MKTYNKPKSVMDIIGNEDLEEVRPIGLAPADKDTIDAIVSGKPRKLPARPPMPPGEPPESLKDLFDEEKIRKRRQRDTVKMAKGGKVSSASKRADGCAIKGKTRGRMV